jgi:hydrogenase nickel incorporation protein HypA/HybF
MHEFSLINDLMRKLEAIAGMHHTQRILGVKIKLGALAHISPDHFREHFVHATRGSSAEGARLEIEVLTDTTDRHAQEIILDSVEIEE